jgi:tRNA-specific 2-thiouridylase
VLSIDGAKNRIVAGTEKETKRSVFTVTECSWTSCEQPAGRFTAKVKVRSATPEAEAKIEPMNTTVVRVLFVAPHSGITPGQSAVFYDNDIVLGGGIIDTVER